MVAINEHTGDKIQTKISTKQFRDNMDKIDWTARQRAKTALETNQEARKEQDQG